MEIAKKAVEPGEMFFTQEMDLIKVCFGIGPFEVLVFGGLFLKGGGLGFT